MKKYLREVMANPEYRKAFEENEIFAMAVMAMTYEIQSEVEVVHFLCKHLKDLCNLYNKLQEANIGVIEIDPDAPNFKVMMEKHLKEQIYQYKVEYGEAPTAMLMGADIQSALADYIIMLNRNIFRLEKTLFGIPLKDDIEGTIALASSGR